MNSTKQKNPSSLENGFLFWKESSNSNPFKFLTYAFEPLHIIYNSSAKLHRNYSLFISVSDFIIHYENPFNE